MLELQGAFAEAPLPFLLGAAGGAFHAAWAELRGAELQLEGWEVKSGHPWGKLNG